VVWLLTFFGLLLCGVLLFLAVVQGVAGLQWDLQRELQRVFGVPGLPFGPLLDWFRFLGRPAFGVFSYRPQSTSFGCGVNYRNAKRTSALNMRKIR
jgi:hypothetical protein